MADPVPALRWWAGRLAPAVSYAVALLVVGAVTATRAPGTRTSWLGWVSTNLDNLSDHPVQALIASAFVVEDGVPYAWAGLALIGLIAVAWRLGPWRALVVVAAAHVVGTAISEGIIAWQMHRGVLPAAARHLIDVGPSYVVVAALVGAVVVGPAPARLAGAAGTGILAPSLFGGITGWDVAALGHVCAILLGATLAFVLRPSADRPEDAVPPPWTPWTQWTQWPGWMSLRDRIVDAAQPVRSRAVRTLGRARRTLGRARRTLGRARRTLGRALRILRRAGDR